MYTRKIKSLCRKSIQQIQSFSVRLPCLPRTATNDRHEKPVFHEPAHCYLGSGEVRHIKIIYPILMRLP